MSQALFQGICSNSIRDIIRLSTHSSFSPSVDGYQPTMASADFCIPIPTPYDASSQRQEYRSPKVMRVNLPLIPAASTTTVSVQVSGFEDNGLLTHCDFLCGDGQHIHCGPPLLAPAPPRRRVPDRKEVAHTRGNRPPSAICRSN